MKFRVAKLQSLVAFLLISICAYSIFAQPQNSAKLAEAKNTFDEAMKIYNQGTIPAYQNALAKFGISAQLYQESGDKNGQGKALVGIGLMNSLLGDNLTAVLTYKQALLLFQETDDRVWEARTINNLGLLYDEMGNPYRALEFHKKALSLRRENKDRAGEATSLNSIGSAYLGLGENQKALEMLNLALAIRRETGNISGEAITLNNIGRVYDELGQDRKALDYFNKSAALRDDIGDRIGRAITLNNIGLVYSDLGEYRNALESYEQSLAIINEFGTDAQKATVLGNMGVAYGYLKQMPKSLEYYLKTLPLNRKSGVKSSEATTLNNLGFAYQAMGDFPKAYENLHQALSLSQTIGSKGLEAIALSNLMRTARGSGNPQMAIFYGKQTVNKYQELRRAIREMDTETQRIYLKSVEESYRFLADLMIEQGLFAEAEGILQMLKEEEFSKFVRRDADEIKSLNRRITLTEKEKQIIEKYSLLANRAAEIGEEFRKLDSRKRLLARREQSLSADEQTKYQLLSQQVADTNAAFRLFLEKELVKELGNKVAKNIELDRNLQEKLRKQGNGTVALYTVLTEDRYRVILTTPTVQVDGKTEIKAEELNKKIFEFLDALQNKNVDPRFLGKEIYDILLKPIEKELKSSNAKTLVWSLDGVLRYIPLGALSPDGETYLIEQYQNVLLTSKTREDAANSKDGWLALGMGVSEEQSVAYPESPNQKVVLSPIPAVKNELLSIIQDENNPDEKGIFKGRRYLDKDFTLSNLETSLSTRNVNGRKKFNVVHFASHFRLGGDWGESFLLLGNGKILTLETLSNSPSLNFDEVELVTLSACKTGITTEPDGKEFESLAGAIQAKGGRTVLATLWDVVDESTSLLMSNFYRIKKENPNLTKAEALQFAQKIMIQGDANSPKIKPSRNGFVADKTRPYSHPYYWSPFVIFGNWR